MSYSELNQDLEVLNFYTNKQYGFFIEIGAYDGIKFSNTYLLEKIYNWKGVCVEPIPQKFELLCDNRKNSMCYNNAVCNEINETVVFDIANNLDLFSGISDNIDRRKLVVESNKTPIVVTTISFNNLLEKCNAPLFIDYLSLDTGGSEYEILKSVDLQKYVFGLIDVDHNFVEPKRSQIRELLTANGYIFIRENNWDDCYKHNSVSQ